MENIKIDLAQENDLDNIARIYMRAFNNAGFGENWKPESTLNFIKYIFTRQRGLFFIATKNKQIVGGCVGAIVPFCDANNMVDIEIFADPDHQNIKIGKKLLKHLISEALKKYKITVLSLHTYRDVDFPYKWYERISIKESNLVHLEGVPQEVLNLL